MSGETKEIKLKLVQRTEDKAIFEEGWWMTAKDYDYVTFNNFESRKYANSFKISLDRNKDTKQITYFFLP